MSDRSQSGWQEPGQWMNSDGGGPAGPGPVPVTSEGELANWAPAVEPLPDGLMAPACPPDGIQTISPASRAGPGVSWSATPAGPGGRLPFRPVASPPRGRFGRGLRLVETGFAMVRDEPGLMGVPVVAFLLQVILIGLAALALLPGLRTAAEASNARHHLTPVQWLITMIAGALVMFVSVVSHATIIARVMARFHGESITNARAARAALTKSPQLLAWAFIDYVVMSILRNIGNRGFVGALFGGLLRAGWMLASFFVVPVILFEDRGAVASIKRSVELCRQRWGENVIGNSALVVIGAGAIVVDALAAILLGTVFAPLGIAVGALGLVLVLLVLTVASAAFNAALYWYAITEQAPGQYSVGDLQSAYRPTRRAGIYGF